LEAGPTGLAFFKGSEESFRKAFMKFRCKQTGNVFEFSWWDIEGMKKHPDYEMVEEEVKTEIEPPKRGRPPKKTEEINE
jgi:ribosomal protein L10